MKIEELNLSALKYFLDAVELESITQSAEKNHISRPAVSQAIIRLGEWYGKQLLSHKKRNFELTDDGREFYQLAKTNFKTLSDGFSKSLKTDDTLRVGCSASLTELMFPKLKSFIDKSQNPLIKIGPTDTLLKMLDQKQIHVAFLIESDKILNYRKHVFHKGNFELRSKSGKPSDLLITTETRPEVESLFRYLAKKRRTPNKHIEVESWTLSQRLAEMMNGMCLLPDYFPKGNMQTVKLSSWNFDYMALMVSHRDIYLSKLELEFVEKFQM